MQAEMTAAEKERQTVRAVMEDATKALDTKTYNEAADREEKLTAKIGRIVSSMKALAAAEHSFTDEDVKAAWDAEMKGYNAEMSKQILEYRTAKRALFEAYIALARKQDRMLQRMIECDSMLKEKPIHNLTSPLRDSVKEFIPAFDKGADEFFRDVRQPEDPERGRLRQSGNGAFADVDTVSPETPFSAAVEAAMMSY